MLGLMVYFGKATTPNPETAMQLFEAAAVKGYPEAQYMVGYLMQSGDWSTTPFSCVCMVEVGR